MLALLLPLALLLTSPSAHASIYVYGASCATPTPSCDSPPYLTLVQSWDPEAGEGGSWFVRSLDVESCDGTKLRGCDPSRAYSSEEIMSFVEKSRGNVWVEGELERSEEEWKGRTEGEGVEETWERAWATSGTCLSTMDPSCHPPMARGAEVAYFFRLAHRMHTLLDPSQILEDADMTPSEDISYSRADVLSTLQAGTSYHPILHCRDGNSLETISWPVELLADDGSASRMRPKFGPRSGLVAAGETGNCPEEGIKIHPSHLSIIRRRDPQPSHTWDPIYRPSPRPIDPAVIAQAAAAAAQREREQEQSFVSGKLGFFHGADSKREKESENVEERDRREGRRATRDEL